MMSGQYDSSSESMGGHDPESRTLPSYEEFCRGVLPEDQSALPPTIQEACNSVDTRQCTTSCSAAEIDFSRTREEDDSVAQSSLFGVLGPRASSNGPRFHHHFLLSRFPTPQTATSVMSSDTFDSSDTSSVAESDNLVGKKKTRTEKNVEALKYILDSGMPGDEAWLAFTQELYIEVDGKSKLFYQCLHRNEEQRASNSTSNICGYLAQRQTVRRHVESRHLGLTRYLCTFCRKKFSQRQAAAVHINGAHLNIKNIQCEACKEMFSDPSRKNKHVSKYHPEAPLKSRRKEPYKHLLQKQIKP